MKRFFSVIRDKIKKIDKKISIFLCCSGAMSALAIAFWINLAGMIALILCLVLKPTFKIGEINFTEPGKIHGKQIVLSHDGKSIVNAPEVEIEYEIKGSPVKWLKKIRVINPDIIIERKDSDVNIVEAFSTGGDGKSGTGVPIGIIEAVNGTVHYRDISYEFPIEKKLYNVNGYVSFNEKDGIDLLFAGEDGEEKVSYSFSNYDFDYWMNIKTENVVMNTDLLQYAYYYKPVQYLGGKVDLNLSISPEGLKGDAKIKDAVVEYSDFSEQAKKIDGTVEFLGKEIKVDADFYIFDQKKKFTLDYDFKKGLDIKIILGDMDFNQVSHYSLLQELEGEWHGLLFKDLLINLRLDEKDIFVMDLTYGIEDMSLDNVTLKNNSGSIRYSEDILTFNFLTSDFSVENFQRKIKIDGILENKKLDVKYWIGDFAGEGSFYLNDNSLDFENKKGFIGLKGNFDYGSKIMQIDELDSSKENFQFIYDFSKKEFIKFDGNFQFNLLDLGIIKVSGTGEDNEFVFDKIEFFQEDKMVLTGEGELDLNMFYYKFSFNSENFMFHREINGKKLELSLSADGTIEGFSSKFKLDLDGTVESMSFENFKFRGLKYNLRFAENILEVNELSNSYFSFKGSYNLAKESIDGKYHIENLSEEEIPFENLRYEIIKASGELRGKIQEPEVTLNIQDAQLSITDGEIVKISGDIELKSKLLSLKNIVINNGSKFTGKYNFNDGEYKLVGDIDEVNLSKYFNDKNFKFRLLGQIEAQGRGQEIQAKGDFRTDDIYFKGDVVGSLKGKISYSAKNFTDGIVKVEFLDFLRNRYEILKLTGMVNLKNQDLNLVVDNRDIEIKKLLDDEKISGVVDVKGSLRGTLNKPNYSLNLSSDRFEVQGVSFTNFITDISGTQELLNLNNLSFNYLDNQLISKGSYEFKNSHYHLDIHSNKIKLDFLNLFLEKTEIKNISGDAEMNLTLSDRGNKGKFQGNDISFQTDKLGLGGGDISFDFTLSGNKILIEKLTGKINDGDANINGYLELPSLVEIRKNPYFYETLDYNLDISLLNFYYESKGYFDFTADSALNISENKISGNIDLLKGNIEEIPGMGEGFSIFGIIRKFIFSTIPQISKDNKTIDKEYGIEAKFADTIAVDLDFKIIESIKVDIQSIWGILEEIRGEIKGGGKLSGTGNKINFLGQFEWDKGSFILGENDYKVLTGRLVFNNPNDYFPDINPILTLETYSQLDGIEIALNGELKGLNFRIKTKNDHSSGTLASLFKNELDYSEENHRLGPSITILKSILGAQITNSFLGPISRTIKKMFGLSKLRMTADITDNFNRYIENEEAQTDETNFNFGIKIVAEDSIYKEKLFAIADARITSSKDSEDKQTIYSGYNNFDRYRAGIEYRYENGKSIGIGVENKGTDGYSKENQQISREKLNYYIDFKIEKKYDSLMDIYRGFIQKIFK